MTKASSNVFPKLIGAEGAAPATPAAGTAIAYVKTDGLWYSKDDAGAETLMSGGVGGGSVATDAIWDAAGDLAVGSGANTAAKLTIGAIGSVLARINGAVGWNGGTAFPTAVNGDRFFRTDLDLEFMYDGTRWVTTTLYRMDLPSVAAELAATGVLTPFQAAWGTAAAFSDLWLVDAFWAPKLLATNTGTHYWTLEIYKQRTGGSADVSVATGTTQSLTASQNHVVRTAIDALAASTAATFYGFATKVSSPTNLTCPAALTYRGVAT